MKLSELPFAEVRIGLEVANTTGSKGKVMDVVRKGIGTRPAVFDTILIRWNKGQYSIIFHHQADYITVVENISSD